MDFFNGSSPLLEIYIIVSFQNNSKNSNSMVWLLCVELKKGELIKAPFVSFIQIIVL